MDSSVVQSYCLKCRKVTASEDVKQKMSKNNRIMLHSKCKICGTKKCKILGKGVVNDILNSGKLPELHLPGHNFTGPGTKLKERLLRGDQPINQLDEAALAHDMAYALFKDRKDRHVFDKKLQKEAFKIAKNPNSSLKEKAEAGLVGSIMFGKRKMGLNNKKPIM